MTKQNILKIITNLESVFYEEKKMQYIVIKFYLNQEKDNKNIFYKNSTGQLSTLLFLANLSEHPWQTFPSIYSTISSLIDSYRQFLHIVFMVIARQR